MTSPGIPLWSPEALTLPPTIPREAQLPGISIIVTSSNETARLRRCLERYFACWAAVNAEVIVVHAGARAELGALARQFAAATWIATDAGTPESALRRIGLERSCRDIVLFLDDSESERHDWTATLCRNWDAWTSTGGRILNTPTCGREGEQSSPYPQLSVVMPVRDGGTRFLLALQALTLSDLPRQSWELVIVDDASTDETAVVAAQYADKLLRLRHGPHGPGYARNRGFELTLGECVAFVNADVMVASDSLRKAVSVLSTNADVGAVFGSCDAPPPKPGFLSEYRSLVQRYYHQQDANDPVAFCSACGIVRSSVFERAGGYDEWHFSRRQLEDLELGQRIRSLGERILLHTEVRATHLRKWTLRRIITTEIFDRAVPWMRLVKRQLTQERGGAQGGRTTKNLNIILTWLGAICAVLACSRRSIPSALTAAACLGVVLANNAARLAFFTHLRGVGFAAVSVPLDFLYYLIAGIGVFFGWIARQAIGEPTPGAVAEAYAEMGVKRWPPVPVKRVARPLSTRKERTVSPSSELADRLLLSQDPGVREGSGDTSQQIQ